MKKLILISLVLAIALGLVFADASAAIKTKKAVSVIDEAVNGVAVQKSARTVPPVKAATVADPSAGIIIGTTDYDYGWNSGCRRMIVVNSRGTKVHMQFMEQDATLPAASGKRAVKYVYYDSTGAMVSGYPVARGTGKTGYGSVDVFWGGDADGIAIIAGHAPNWFGIDNGPGAANFTSGYLTGTVGTNDPSVTIDQATKRIYYNDSHSAARDNILARYSDDYGTSWTLIDTTLIKVSNGVSSSLYVMANIDNKIIEAPNGELAIVTCIKTPNEYAIPPLGTSASDTADQVGYFKSIDQGKSWTWNRLGIDGQRILIGTDTIYNLFENFGSLDAVYDKNSNLQVVIQMYGQKLITDTTASNYFGTLYWSGLTGWKLISNPEDMHIDDFDSPAYNTGAIVNGNAFGHPYPAIAIDPNGDGVFAVWSQTRVIGGKLDTAWNGMVNYDLWYSYSNNLGVSWSVAQKLANTNGGLFASAAAILTKPSASTYRAHFVYLADTSAGNFVFGTGEDFPVDWIYRTIDFTSVTGVKDNPAQLKKFTLDQNYPNPFNPSTSISYTVSKAGFVSLKIYDVLGREVATLVNEVKQAGTYPTIWNASGFGSGTYFYKMQSGSYTETKKMILMK